MCASDPVWIDSRPAVDFHSATVSGAYHLPAEFFRELSCALPGRHVPLRVIAAAAAAAALQTQLIAMKYEDMRVLSIEECGLPLVAGSTDTRRHCWAPCDFLNSEIDFVEQRLKGTGVALDVGCGTARDSVFLALRGWSMIGFDNRAALIKKAQLLARHHGAQIETQVVNLRRCMPYVPGSFDLVVVSRFLHRSTLRHLFTMPSVGGCILYSHFLDGCQHTAVGTPSTPEGFLFREDLATIAAELKMDVVVDRATTLPDGRPIVEFLAFRVV